jgi:ABC-type siderophore export system fused ATPase/permease subunit
VVEEVRNQGDEAALAGLPSTVRNDAMQYVYLPHLERCPLLKKCSKHFLHMLLSHAHVEVFTKKV